MSIRLDLSIYNMICLYRLDIGFFSIYNFKNDEYKLLCSNNKNPYI